METLKAVIVSRSMALRVADQLKLAESEALLGDMIAEGPPAGTSEEAWLEERRQAAASYLMGGVEVAVPLNTRIIEIGFSADDPQLAANAANAYVDNFLTDNVSRSMEANAYARDFLEKEIEQTRNELRDAELRAIEYARANRIIGQLPQDTYGQDIGTAPTLTATELETTAAQLAEARADRIEAEQRWRTVSNVPAAQLPEVRENSAIEAMKTRVAGLNAQMSDLRERYREDYPPCRRNAEIARLRHSTDS